jgi:hypothetical protein
MEDVSNVTVPGLGVCVDGDDVDIKRFWSFDAVSVAVFVCPSLVVPVAGVSPVGAGPGPAASG